MCGRKQKLSRTGEPYGWNSTVFTTVEDFWGEDMTLDISAAEAYEKIRERILLLNPEAKEKDIRKFIGWKKPMCLQGSNYAGFKNEEILKFRKWMVE